MNEPNQAPEEAVVPQEPTPSPAPDVPAAEPLPPQPEVLQCPVWWSKLYFLLRRKRKYLCVILAAVILGCLAYGIYLSQSANEFASLSQQKQQAVEPVAASEPVVSETLETQPQEKTILPQFQELAAQNPDFFGWVTIADTRIDYPVMHTPEEPEKYLYANFDGEYRFSGTPFLDASCSPDSTNLIIHGHNMLDGSMFRGLLNYKEKSYWEAHPTIQFSTLYEESEYEILAAFPDRVYYDDEDCFKFYNFINAEGQVDFDEAMKNFAEKALYDTGITASYGDQLIMLVTCAYHTDNGRFVVLAREME